MEYYDEKLFIFGNAELLDTQGYFIAFDLQTDKWTTPSPASALLPNNRIFHCSFVYQVRFY